MNPVIVKGLKIGEGIPKICVPIVEKSSDKIIEMANLLADSPADLVEWRADWFEDVLDFEKTKEVLVKLQEILKDMPILFTLRTRCEGGEKEVNQEEYLQLNKKVLDAGCVDLIDIEALSWGNVAKELINSAHAADVKVIASHHDFQKTPDEETMISKLNSMKELGPDILKIAVMPKNKEDVVSLLSVTNKMATEPDACPIISMSMSKKGTISRVAGEIFGSAITFGTIGKASAPGQISVHELKKILELMHG